MRPFISDNFLLGSDLAVSLYREVGNMGIVDFHNHLDPAAMAENRHYDNIARLWVTADPYKHRAMRMCGVPEHLISGDAEDYDKFLSWAEICPRTVGGPLFHWSALEMKRVFGIDELLTPGNAREIWDECNRQLGDGGLGCNDILKGFRTEILCTSDDFRDDVTLHGKASENGFEVYPSLRADSILAFDTDIADLSDYLDYVSSMLDKFDAAGCRLADHALDGGFSYVSATKGRAQSVFSARHKAGDGDMKALRSYVLTWLACEYGKRGWVMQLHIGAQRYTSGRLRSLCGPAGGYASIGSCCDIAGLCAFLNAVEARGCLPRTILYTLNPADNAAFATLCGSFAAEDGMPKVLFGPAWWYNDHKLGMESHLDILGCYGLLSSFIGMTTDSRSFLSLSRHEYFRRILCNYVASKAASGEFPDDYGLMKNLVTGICRDNAYNWIIKR